MPSLPVRPCWLAQPEQALGGPPPHLQRVVLDDRRGCAKLLAEYLDDLQHRLRMLDQCRHQIAGKDSEDLAILQRNGVGRALVAVEGRDLSVDVPFAQKVQDHLFRIRIDVGDLDTARQQHHHAVAALPATVDDASPRISFGVPAPYQGVERRIRQPTEEGVVSEEGPDPIQQRRMRAHVRSPSRRRKPPAARVRGSPPRGKLVLSRQLVKSGSIARSRRPWRRCEARRPQSGRSCCITPLGLCACQCVDCRTKRVRTGRNTHA